MDYKTGLDIGDKVIDLNGYIGIVTAILEESGQIQVQQKKNVWNTYGEVNKLSLIKIKNQENVKLDFE